jgi:hypothetical protein
MDVTTPGILLGIVAIVVLVAAGCGLRWLTRRRHNTSQVAASPVTAGPATAASAAASPVTGRWPSTMEQAGTEQAGTEEDTDDFDDERPGRHRVPDELMNSGTHRMDPELRARAKVPRPRTGSDPAGASD